MRRWFAIGVFALFAFGAGSVQADGWYSRSYKQGMKLFNRGQYLQSIKHFRELLDASRKNDLSDNCQYWIGEAYYQLGKYEQAIVEFDRTLTYPGTNKREDALYKLANCHEKKGEIRPARELYLRLMMEYPKTRHGQYVMKRIKELKNL